MLPERQDGEYGYQASASGIQREAVGVPRAACTALPTSEGSALWPQCGGRGERMDPTLARLVDAVNHSCADSDADSLEMALKGLRVAVVLSPPSATIGPRHAFGTLLPVGDAIGQFVTQLGPERWRPLLDLLAADAAAEVRCVACRVLGWIGMRYPQAVVPVAYRLGADPQWEVREFIANAIDDPMCREQGAFVFDLMSAWTQDADANVRRVPTNALMRYGRQHPTDVITLMGRLLHDESRYVRDNVVFCLGVMGAVRVPLLGGGPSPDRPQVLMQFLREWVEDDDQRARWIVAKTLGRSWTKSCTADALALLRQLAADGRRPVRVAVSSSLKALAKANPTETALALSQWLEDDNIAVRAAAGQARSGTISSSHDG